MFESLIASGPQDHIRARQYILSAAFHFALVVGAVGLTAHPGTTTRVQRDQLKILFVAPQLRRPAPAPPSHSLPNHLKPAPSWQPNVQMPPLVPPPLPAGVPTVAELLADAGTRPGAVSASPSGSPAGDLTTLEPLGAEAVDDPARVIHQPPPRYPSALSHAGITGRVELDYVVDTTGHAEARSLRTLESTHPAFEAAARASVLAARYSPARVRGRVVRQLVRQTLSFRLVE
ncbi:MAG TPA: TonB family protein [Gemmatimonadales bacterium]|nr:TonB family protein [Gemmatimonadales bacterium]